MQKFIFFPDAPAGSAGEPNDVHDTHIRHLKNVPAKDAVLLSVSETATAQWIANPAFGLLWKTSTDFQADVTAFKDELEKRNVEGGSRPSVTTDLDNLDNKIHDALPFVKSYSNYKWGPHDGPSHYPAFGMEHKNHHYDFPIDRDKRKTALTMMVNAIHDAGFDGNEYGKTFWTDLQTKYNAQADKSTDVSGNISDHVSNLVQLRTTLRRVLHSILLLLEANYPDTFAQMRRAWGFQKEKY